MKKLLFFGLLLSLGAVSCRTQCPAYSSTKPALHPATPATPVLASASASTSQQ